MSAHGVSVLVPTYRRPAYVRRCVGALRAQTVVPDEIIVIRRRDDTDSEAAINEIVAEDLNDVVIEDAGVVAALVAGVRAASGEILAFVDDDAVPHRDWLENLLRYFDDPAIGAVGGRDIVQDDVHARLQLTTEVGLIGRWGKMRGNHHLGTGPPRDVMVLKGANMAFRRAAIALPRGLRGRGAQVHFEIAMSLWAIREGWRLVYDPSIVVDHFIGPRFDADHRGRPASSAVRNAAYNYVAALLSQRRDLLLRRAAFGLLVGDRAAPGLIRTAAAVFRGEPDVALRLVPSLIGQTHALWHATRRRSIEMVPIGRIDREHRPTVALVAHEIHDHGGMEKALAELIRVGRGHVNFVVVSRYLAPDLRHLVDWRRVPAPNRPFPLKFSLFFVLAGARLRAVRADVVHTMGAIVPNRADVATVQFCHAAHRQIALRASIDRRPALRRLNTAISSLLSVAAERWLYRPSRTRALAAVSRGVARELRERYPCVSVLLTPNGVDLERFRPDPDVRRAFRATHGVGTGEVVALFVGGDWERKGPAIAIRAVARATREAPLRLWVVGRGDEERLGRVAAEHGVEDRVSFFGPRADSERFFQAADVFVFPSAYEGFPLALLEAAASALPLVVTATNGVDELVGDGSCGIVVQRTTDSVARALVRLANSPELRAELGIAARAQAQEFTWQRSVESVIDSYSRLLPSSMVIPEPV